MTNGSGGSILEREPCKQAKEHNNIKRSGQVYIIGPEAKAQDMVSYKFTIEGINKLKFEKLINEQEH